ncbi:hypothetical protein B0T21DRAFT_126820 [Apiosordaria backusii]|uniref:Transmembrane protein n=1 Tax=Apiosordaria backusii TaxID=314023 RepID=A0AA40K183_9PEZI|nr:hypothetical protein B0T21DRAFT_126820 [Apiosordaria backusii]
MRNTNFWLLELSTMMTTTHGGTICYTFWARLKLGVTDKVSKLQHYEWVRLSTIFLSMFMTMYGQGELVGEVGVLFFFMGGWHWKISEKRLWKTDSSRKRISGECFCTYVCLPILFVVWRWIGWNGGRKGQGLGCKVGHTIKGGPRSKGRGGRGGSVPTRCFVVMYIHNYIG